MCRLRLAANVFLALSTWQNPMLPYCLLVTRLGTLDDVVTLSAELTEDLVTIATKSGVAKTRVLKMFASHIAGFFVQIQVFLT